MSTTEHTDEIRPEHAGHDGSATDTPHDPVVQADLAPDEEELEVPRDLKATIRRMWDAAREQHWRLYVVGTALVFFVIVTAAGEIYTAYLLDLLWEKIQAAWSGETAFTVTWMDGGIQIMGLLLLYTVQWVFYSTQTFVMASFAERLNLKLRNQVGVRVAELFAEELAKTTLVMTATFNDGSEQTKRYSFSPREDYAQIYAEYLEEDWDAYLTGDDARRTELTQNPPSLYLITENEG